MADINLLDKDLEELKKLSAKDHLSRLNDRIFNLNLNHGYLSTLTQNELAYIHVKLHNALSYKKPFASIENIKRVHSILAPLLKNHVLNDELDY